MSTIFQADVSRNGSTSPGPYPGPLGRILPAGEHPGSHPHPSVSHLR